MFFLSKINSLLYYFILPYLILSIKQKTKHTTVSSVKSSTICIRYLILQLHLFVSKSDKFLSDRISTLQKSVFFVCNEHTFFLIQHLICCVSKRTKYTTGCSVKNSTNCNGQFILCMQFLLLRTSKLLSDQFPRLQIFYPNEDLIFSYFIFFSPNGFFFKETEYGERCTMKTLQITNNSLS